MHHTPEPTATSSSEEVRVTSDTGGQKGKKLQEYAHIPPAFLNAVAAVFGYGAGKYDAYNYAKGYKWTLSYSALQRHLNLFWRGELNDRESGLSHLAHAAFHLAALFLYSTNEQYRKFDDRPDVIADLRVLWDKRDDQKI